MGQAAGQAAGQGVTMAEAARLILASGSAARRAMLEAAGLTFDVLASDVDEVSIKALMISESDCLEAADLAVTLAVEKAMVVARAHPGAFVIGADQVLVLGRKFFSKATTLYEAREILDALRGRTHELVSAAAIARSGDVLWHTHDFAEMTMRPFSDEFLGNYLQRGGEKLLQSVGCYQLEGPGVQLFEHIDGDYFTILGMPLFPLLAKLRELDVVTA